MRSEGKLDDADYRELVSRLSTSLAMVEAAYMEARRRGCEAVLRVAKSV
jgi:Iap family predicted aminopeptidase